MDEVTMAKIKGALPAAVAPATLPDHKELALIAIERARMAFLITDPRQPDNPIVLANSGFLKLTGYISEEVLGRNCRFLQGPDTDPADAETIRRGLAAGSDPITAEILNYRKDGSAFWNEVLISPILNDAGELIYHFGCQTDVTARRRVEQMEATQRLMSMEASSRIQQSKGLSLANAAEAVHGSSSLLQGRVDALARAHRLLAASGWLSVDLAQFIAGDTPVEARARVSTTGTHLEVPARLAQPLALVLHELMSNAVKHGALAQRGGRVRVNLAEQNHQLVLHWREIGGKGLASPPEPGYGLQMMVHVVEQLGGRVTASWIGQGLEIEMALPAR
jgi:PAS domain S-box-containing protein